MTPGIPPAGDGPLHHGPMAEGGPVRINGRTFASPLDLTEGYRRGEVSLVQAAAGLSKWGWPPPRIAQVLTHPSGHRGRTAAGADDDGAGPPPPARTRRASVPPPADPAR